MVREHQSYEAPAAKGTVPQYLTAKRGDGAAMMPAAYNARMSTARNLGGIIDTYQKYDSRRLTWFRRRSSTCSRLEPPAS
jgi:hypothetical protein